MTTEALDPNCTDPQELFGLGVRAFILEDHEQAVEALSKATELLVQQHNDDLHESLGKVYLFYGKALLGSARANIEPLGEAVPKSAFDESDEDEEEEDEGIEAENTNGEANEPAKEVHGPVEIKDGPSTSKPEEPEEDEDAGDLELAWEVLELAKKIFEKQGDKKQMAETLIVLGEVSLESGNFESAINDIKQGLELQKELFAKDSRTVAETLYKLGMAYSTNTQMEEAINNFKAALEYLNNRIKMLEETKSQGDELKEEIAEIRELIPDIEEKIVETRVYKDEAKKTLAEALNGTAAEKPQGSSTSSPQPASNISHLVKRKRKVDNEDNTVEAEERAAKKPATD